MGKPWRKLSPLLRYGAAVLASLSALALALAAEPIVGAHFILSFLAAVALSGWLLGLGPAAAATGLTTVLFAGFFVERRDAHGAGHVITFATVNLFITWLIARLQKHHDELAASEQRYRELSGRLARSNTELEQFAYIASHDLQEPLRMVASYTQLLAENYRGNLDHQGHKYIEYACEGARRMQALINGILDYSRLGRHPPIRKSVDAGALFEEVLHEIDPAARETAAAVTHDPLPVVNADSTQLGQLFHILAGNAIKFRGAEPPRIHVSAAEKNGNWVFSVCDNGIGIDPRYRERIFVMFQRLHSRERYPGTGIGLALAKRIAEGHDGRIWVESTPGHGSTFYFTLPKG